LADISRPDIARVAGGLREETVPRVLPPTGLGGR